MADLKADKLRKELEVATSKLNKIHEEFNGAVQESQGLKDKKEHH